MRSVKDRCFDLNVELSGLSLSTPKDIRSGIATEGATETLTLDVTGNLLDMDDHDGGALSRMAPTNVSVEVGGGGLLQSSRVNKNDFFEPPCVVVNSGLRFHMFHLYGRAMDPLSPSVVVRSSSRLLIGGLCGRITLHQLNLLVVAAEVEFFFAIRPLIKVLLRGRASEAGCCCT